ncbi:MAG: hypothetical protein NZ480_08695 [Bdellovibrionaceae bacterium]|nr:hypothetical protein [Pseudobdellovibrionaceae bacterium]MDW8189595.1 hypothetical protein [Pseudobdellovibrionaceae bacterium]
MCSFHSLIQFQFYVLWFKRFSRFGVSWGLVALILFSGNTSCKEEQQAGTAEQGRQLRRRVQMGTIKAPEIQLPQGGKFDFQYAANAQLYHVLTKTQAFSTATIDPNKIYDPSGLSDVEANQFRRCEDQDEVMVYYRGFGYVKESFSKVAGCMIDLPQGLISGNIIDFALINKTNFRLGLPQIPLLSGFEFEFQKFELSMGMRVMHPLIQGGIQSGDRKIIATTEQNKYVKDYGFGLKLNFSGFEFGPSMYFKSPLRKVVDDALVASVTDLARQWNLKEPWYAMILRACDKYIYVNAGSTSDANLKVGDILRIHNVTYRWRGPACKAGSQLLGAIDAVEGPVGYARVVSVGDTMSAALVLDNDPQYPHSREVIRPGARVYMEKMVEPPQKPKENSSTKK